MRVQFQEYTNPAKAIKNIEKELKLASELIADVEKDSM
jgi:hypothetical protein